MGRAMLIIVTGLMVALGYTFMGMASQKSAMTIRNVKSANEAMARNLAHTGIQFAIQELNTSSWPSGQENTKTRSIDGKDIHYYWEEGGTNRIKITSTASSNEVTDEVIATIVLEDIVDISQVPGAMGVYGENTQVRVNGQPPAIDGRDYEMGYTEHNPEGQHKPGVVGVNNKSETFSKKEPNLYGAPSGYEHKSSLDGQPWDEIIDSKYLPNAEEFDNDLGSKSEPKIIRVSGNNARAGGNGAGILIIEEDATFTISGNNHFYGLIIVRGDLNLKGTPQIYGSIIFTDNSSVDVDDPEGVYGGTPDIRFSSDALENVNKNLKMNKDVTIVSIFD